jgi:hypothetical protein
LPAGCATIASADIVLIESHDVDLWDSNGSGSGGGGGETDSDKGLSSGGGAGLRLHASVRYNMKRASNAVYVYSTEMRPFSSPPMLYRATRAACRAHTAAVAVAAQKRAGNMPAGVVDRSGQNTMALREASNNDDDDGCGAPRFLVTRRSVDLERMRNANFIVVIGAGAHVSLLLALNLDLVGTHESGRERRYHDSHENSPEYLGE